MPEIPMQDLVPVTSAEPTDLIHLKRLVQGKYKNRRITIGEIFQTPNLIPDSNDPIVIPSGLNNVSISPSGINCQLQFNDNGSFAGTQGISYDKSSQTLSGDFIGNGQGLTGVPFPIFNDDIYVNLEDPQEDSILVRTISPFGWKYIPLSKFKIE